MIRTKKDEQKHIEEHKSAFAAALAKATMSVRQNPSLVGLNKIREPIAFQAALKATGFNTAPVRGAEGGRRSGGGDTASRGDGVRHRS